ncbi:MAG: hypothetical protein IKU51_07510 [Clostridia bacterium]|nr:hypothetical protein [Clostridia bacterium]
MKMRKVLSVLLATLMLLTMIPLGAISVSAADYTYDPDAAVAYAKAHWNDGVGLCARFVSDCIKAGGFTKAYSGSVTTLVGQLESYTTKITCSGWSTTTCLTASMFNNQLSKGDIIVWKGPNNAGHVLLYSGKTNSKGQVLVYAHNAPMNEEPCKPNSNFDTVYALHIPSAPHSHYHDKYVYYLAAHPHHKCYQCTCGDVAANYSTSTYVDTCEICNPPCSHTYDNTCDASCNQCGAVREVNDHTWTIATCSEAKTCTICGATDGEPLGHKWDITIKQCSVCGKKITTEYDEWSDNLPAEITEDVFDIETKTVYRYRDNSTHVIYGEWSSEQTTSTKPTESDTLTIVSTTMYYNYYHYCCNYYDGSYNVDSIPYGSGNQQYHTIRLTYELSAKNVGDKGGKQLYGSYTCGKGFNVWARADQYITYEYKYKTRTATNVVDYGTWSAWSDSRPATAANRDIESKTMYRYKLKHVHAWSDATCTSPKTCTDCGATEGNTLGHNYISEVTKQPTCTIAGVKTYICSACGDSYTESIPATGVHVYVDEYDADCNECGTIRDVSIPGDANGDNSITIRDVTLLQQYLAGWDVFINEATADADGDGRIIIRDLTLLQQYLAGWNVKLG